MDQLQQLGDPATLLRQLFTPTVLLWALIGTVVSAVGFAAYRRGKKSKRRVLVWGGVALMVYPYVVYDPIAMIALGAAICLGMVALRDAL